MYFCYGNIFVFILSLISQETHILMNGFLDWIVLSKIATRNRPVFSFLYVNFRSIYLALGPILCLFLGNSQNNKSREETYIRLRKTFIHLKYHCHWHFFYVDIPGINGTWDAQWHVRRPMARETPNGTWDAQWHVRRPVAYETP